MSIEACSSYDDDEMYTRSVDSPLQTTWNHHLVTITTSENLSHLIPKSPPPMDAGGSVQVEARIDWGGDKTTYSGNFKGTAEDDNGNYAEVKAEVKSDNTGSISVSAGHKEEDEKDK